MAGELTETVIRTIPEDLPSVRTMRRVMNRFGFRLRRVQKTKPAKKIPQTDAIFQHVKRAHARSDQEDDCLRISIDAKAKVKVGEFSRGGRSRDREPKKAGDHDMNPKATLVPFGILETESAQFTVVLGTSRETSDFIVDCLQLWWDERKAAYPHILKLQIDLDNGPELASNRTQFISRMVQFADQTGLTIELVYYPPYHSKYNSVERCWGILARFGRELEQLPLIRDRPTRLEQAVAPIHAQAAPGVGLTGKLFSSGCLRPGHVDKGIVR